MSEGKHGGHDEGEDEVEVLVRQVRQGEEEHVEDDAADVEGDERDQDLSERRLQVHVLPIEHGDRQNISYKRCWSH